MVVISIIAVLSVVGFVAFQNVRAKALDAKRKADIDAIKKAYETNFDPTLNNGQGGYKPLADSMFASGKKPTQPNGSPYPCVYGPDLGCSNNSDQGYVVSATLSDNSSYKATSNQGNLLASIATAPSNSSISDNLLIWLKADSITGLADGASVTTWNDSSSAGNNANQANTAGSLDVNNKAANANTCITQGADTDCKPKYYSTGGPNSTPVVRLDGVNDYMYFNTRLTTIRTVFAVIKWTGGTTGAQYADIIGDHATYDFHGGSALNLLHSASNVVVYNGDGYANGTKYATPLYNTLQKPTTTAIIEFVTTGDARGGYIANNQDLFDGGNRFWAGDYSELIVYNSALTEQQRQGVEAYLSQKYGIPIH